MTSEASWNATSGKEEDGWRLEPEGEMETLETKVLWKGVEGAPGYPDGEGPHERVQVKSSRRESEAPGEEGEEVKSPKRKAIRVESEETQDYVREAKDLNQEEAEEISFVASAMERSANATVAIDAVKRPSVSDSFLAVCVGGDEAG